ncbi:MAG: efflux RND transporter periplasmic adaptor subunit [Alphaproteobacteria bacterium]|nr:efflux RND transporter periplasmic adaptor subunit [Alphaproteobacteria bacterium]
MTVSPTAIERPGEKPGRRGPLLLGLVMIALLAAGYLGWQHFMNRPSAAPASPTPVPVIAATVQKQNFPIVLTGIGNVAALNSATVRSMVTEQIISIEFKDGQLVKKGQLLAQLDPSTYQAQLDQAEANLTRDEAHLENGRINLKRYIPLQKQGFAPEQQVATQGAKIAQEEAVIKADQAAIEYAKTELNYTKLVAPFDGVAGIRLLDVGNIIHSSTTRGSPSEPNALVVINQVQPISVMFTLGASDIPDVQEALAKGPVKVIALSADAKTELDTGTLAALDNQANTTSGTITLKAIFPNSGRKLWPGMFVNVRVITQVQGNGLTVPLDAVQQGPQGQYVFVVDSDHKVAMQPISVRETLNGEALIDKGLSAGETVVVRGQYRLTPGTVVSLANPNDPAAVPNPAPASAGLLP